MILQNKSEKDLMVDKNYIDDKFRELNEKLSQFSAILEKFGLDLITKLGQTNLKLNKLTDKVNDLDQATLDIKSMKPQLNTVIESQRQLRKDIELIQNLVQNVKTISKDVDDELGSIKRDKVATDVKLGIIKQFNDLRDQISSANSPQTLAKPLGKIKEEIFEFTGGHRINYEISQVINRLNSIKLISDPFDINDSESLPFDKYLHERITFWINKLDVKD
jgi:vacuolar-type H+-ATPase subunit I/STV1